MKDTVLIAGVSLAALLAGAPAYAQDNPAGAGDVAAAQAGQDAVSDPAPGAAEERGADQISDIVVTGRKRARAEELQRVPVAITALSAAQLQQSTVRTLVDVGGLVPNASLQASAQKGVQNFAIRGMGVSGTTPSD
ncbi:MAG: Plug domain-containing protein, partial [Novosphingobium sp.]|nr:Plug domain-containing protein [Novosphingobium sp.]